MNNQSSDEAQNVSKAVIQDLVENVISASQSMENSEDGDDEPGESLSTVLESLTEESAKEIFADAEKPVLSESTSKIIASFISKKSSPAKKSTNPVEDDFSSDEEGNLVIVEPVQQAARSSRKLVKNLDEITFSDNSSEDRTSINISWEAIESRPSSSAAAVPLQKEKSPPKKSDYVMKEVIDEFAATVEDESSSGAETIVTAKRRGRRVKSQPRKKKVSPAVTVASKTLEEDEGDKVAEDVDQIVAFIRQENAHEQEKCNSLQGQLESKDVVSPPSASSSLVLDKKSVSHKKKRKGGGGKKKKTKSRKSAQKKVVKLLSQENGIKEESVVKETSVAEKRIFKPIQNWHKIMRISSSQPLSQSTVDQIFCNVIAPYVPCVPRNTSQRLIDALSEKELEQLCCPGCKDRFLLPTSFFQHIYRKSARITFTCGPCGHINLAFYNRCHLRIHVLSHLEIDGINSVSIPGPETLNVAPLEASEVNTGFIDDTYTSELETLFSDYKLQYDNAKRCPECRVPVEDKEAHFQGVSEAFDGAKFECEKCKSAIPTRCALEAHKRIHGRTPVHVCPECGLSFESWVIFKHHLQTTCHHEGRVLAVKCVLCTRKNEGQSAVFVDLETIYAHFYELHVGLFYKCSDCEKAFAEKSAIYEHRAKEGGKGHSKKGLTAEFSLLYQASFLKGPSKLFSTREAFEERISPVIKSWQKSWKFKCIACQSLFDSASDLSRHNTNWCQLQHSNVYSASKLFPDQDQQPLLVSNEESNSSKALTASEAYEKMNEHLAHLEALTSEVDTCHDCAKIGLDFRAHLVSHTKSGRRMTTSTVATTTFSDGSAEKPLISDESKAAAGLRITRQRLEAHVEPSITPNKRPPPPPSTPQDPPPIKKVRKMKAKKASGPEVKPFVETLGIDVISTKRLMSFNKLSSKALAFGATARPKARPSSQEASRFNCALCDFSTELRDSFGSHIRIHKPVIHREGPTVAFNEAASDCFQCKECGMCFASEASWKKHLFLLHRIKKPQASDYCEDLITSPVDAEASVEATMQPRNVCNVCRRGFASELELRRHFRTHGMAFIMQHPESDPTGIPRLLVKGLNQQPPPS